MTRHPPTLALYYRLLIHDAKGRLVRKTRLRRSRSFVIQFLEGLYADGSGADYTFTDITNTERIVDFNSGASHMGMAAAAGTVTAGIVAGTGSTAPTNNDYALGAKIAQGSGSGQLNYANQLLSAPVVSGSYVELVMSRAMQNNSGASITVNEIGIDYERADTGATVRAFLAVRDVLSPGVAVGATQTLTVQYTIRTTV